MHREHNFNDILYQAYVGVLWQLSSYGLMCGHHYFVLELHKNFVACFFTPMQQIFLLKCLYLYIYIHIFIFIFICAYIYIYTIISYRAMGTLIVFNRYIIVIIIYFYFIYYFKTVGLLVSPTFPHLESLSNRNLMLLTRWEQRNQHPTIS